MPNIIAVTGGAGFLGRYVTKEVNGIALDNLDPLCGGESSFPCLPTDVSDYNSLYERIRYLCPDAIIHLAAYGRNLTCQDHPRRAWDVNVTGTRNVLEVARELKIPRVVCCSSNIVLSQEYTVYRATKEADEKLVALYSLLGVSCMALRPSNIYGLGQSHTEYQPCAFAGLDNSFAEHQCFKVSGDGTQSRDFVHALDVARAFNIALESNIRGVTFDIATGIQTSINDVARMLNIPVEYTKPRPGDAKKLVSNTTQALYHLGFVATEKLEDRIEEAFPLVVINR